MWEPYEITANNFTSLGQLKLTLNRGAYLIQGENLDDKGQGSNGSGKTSVIDIPAVVLIGESLTGRDLKSCVNWNSDTDHFTVSMSMKHLTTGQNAFIQRKVYSSTKSSELVILVDGQVPVGMPTKHGVKDGVDIKAGNEYILKNLLGITKEDLLNYYLISGGTYTAFMKASNSKKVEVINRFSNGKLIDDIIENIEDIQLQQKQSIVDQFNLQKSQFQFHIEALQQSLNSTSREQFEADKAARIAKIADDIEIKVHGNEKLNAQIAELQSITNQIQGNIDSFVIEDFNDEIKQANVLIKDLSKQIGDVKFEINSSSEMDNVYENTNSISSMLASERDTLAEVVSLIKDLNAQLAGEITCPKCENKFYLDQQCDHQSIKVQLREAKDLQRDCRRNVEQLEKDLQIAREQEKLKIAEIQKAKSELRHKLHQLETEKSGLTTQIALWKNQMIKNQSDYHCLQDQLIAQQNKINSINTSISSNQRIIDSLFSEIESIENSRFEDKVGDIEKQISHYEKKIDQLSEQLMIAEKEVDEIKQWISNFEDFKFFMANKPIEAICSYINNYLQQNDSELLVYLEGFRKLKNGKIRQELDPLIFRNSKMQPYAAYSEGEKARINLATDLAFQHIINNTSPTGGLNYYQNDELLNPLDSKGVSNAAHGFNKIDKVMLLATHSGADVYYSKTIKVIKKGGFSEAK